MQTRISIQIPSELLSEITNEVGNSLVISPNNSRPYRWSLEMDTLFHTTLYNAWSHLHLLEFKSIHITKMGPRIKWSFCWRHF